MRSVIDLTDQRFGRLIVLKLIGRINNRTLWECRCDCGKVKQIDSCSLRQGHIKSCGCLAVERTKEVHSLPHGQASFNKLYNSYKMKAVARHFGFYLKEADFRELTSKPCFYCGVLPYQIYLPKSKTGISNGSYTYNGIDRLDSTKDYTVENCVPCCGICNKMKMDLPLDVFINKCRKIVDYVEMGGK